MPCNLKDFNPFQSATAPSDGTGLRPAREPFEFSTRTLSGHWKQEPVAFADGFPGGQYPQTDDRVAPALPEAAQLAAMRTMAAQQTPYAHPSPQAQHVQYAHPSLHAQHTQYPQQGQFAQQDQYAQQEQYMQQAQFAQAMQKPNRLQVPMTAHVSGFRPAQQSASAAGGELGVRTDVALPVAAHAALQWAERAQFPEQTAGHLGDREPERRAAHPGASAPDSRSELPQTEAQLKSWLGSHLAGRLAALRDCSERTEARLQEVSDQTRAASQQIQRQTRAIQEALRQMAANAAEPSPAPITLAPFPMEPVKCAGLPKSVVALLGVSVAASLFAVALVVVVLVRQRPQHSPTRQKPRALSRTKPVF